MKAGVVYLLHLSIFLCLCLCLCMPLLFFLCFLTTCLCLRFQSSLSLCLYRCLCLSSYFAASSAFIYVYLNLLVFCALLKFNRWQIALFCRLCHSSLGSNPGFFNLTTPFLLSHSKSDQISITHPYTTVPNRLLVQASMLVSIMLYLSLDLSDFMEHWSRFGL